MDGRAEATTLQCVIDFLASRRNSICRRKQYSTYIVSFALVDKLQAADVDCFAVEDLDSVFCDGLAGARAFLAIAKKTKLRRFISTQAGEVNPMGYVGRHQVWGLPTPLFKIVLRDLQLANTTRLIAASRTKDGITVEQLVNACRISCKITTRTTSRP